jgi:hypothetical protein
MFSPSQIVLFSRSWIEPAKSRASLGRSGTVRCADGEPEAPGAPGLKVAAARLLSQLRVGQPELTKGRPHCLVVLLVTDLDDLDIAARLALISSPGTDSIAALAVVRL